MILYAPTTSGKVERVLAQGLRKSCDLTDDLDFAEDVALEMAEARNEDPVVLEIEVDERDLRVSWEAYDDPPARAAMKFGAEDPDAWDLMRQAGDIPFPSDERDWETALETVLWVCHPGPIAPDRIRVAAAQEEGVQEAIEQRLRTREDFEHPESEV